MSEGTCSGISIWGSLTQHRYELARGLTLSDAEVVEMISPLLPLVKNIWEDPGMTKNAHDRFSPQSFERAQNPVLV